MVKGLEIFRQFFADLADSYILIGGSACDINLTAMGAPFRVTKDLDIVLCVEAKTNLFVHRFWDFVRAGGYTIAQRSSDEEPGKRLFFRFQKPARQEYPQMLELMSRKPDWLTLPPDVHATPIPLSYDISSLSAILLDDDYYHFILAHRHVLEGVSLATPSALIVLKAKAWMNLTDARLRGEQIVSGDITKHKNDIARLVPFAGQLSDMPDSIKSDMRDFLERYDVEPIDGRQLHLPDSVNNIKVALHRLLE